jgi:sec-independent protein translocase protein TatA
MPNVGPTELIIVLLIVLVVFGPKKLPGLGRSLGTSMREFKDSITGKDDEKSIAAGDDDDDPVTAEPPAKADRQAKAEQHDDAVSRPR